jgi:hypothetical protein
MACEFIYPANQSVALNTPILFNDSIPCRRGNVYHADGEGVFILRGNVNNQCACYATYQVTYNGNITVPEGGTVPTGGIAIAITVNGEPKRSSRAITVPATAGTDYGNVTSTAIIKVPKGCCFSVSVEPVAASADPTVTPAPIIDVIDSNLVISRIA